MEGSSEILNHVFNDKALVETIKAQKLLLVGCGGIGCEVIKNLLLIGFRDVTMIDLDTIDVSNLNRQFLFNKSHINQSKANITAQVASNLFAHHNESNYNIKPLHGSIQNQEYNVDFFKQFTLVINALDNRQARSHVNRMCLAADIPLIESGSEGYYGQTFVIKKNVSACYECDGPKPDQKTYASCTIRNTPSLPIHCIVWAKHLFAQLFGEADPDNDVSPDVNDPELSNGNDKENSSKLASDQASLSSTKQWVQSNNYDEKLLFDKLFRLDIEYLHKMDKLWKNRNKPISLNLSDLDAEASCSNVDNLNSNDQEALKDQKLLTLRECFDVFENSVRTLKKRLATETYLVWDKDDDVALNFVTAVSNLRSFCFHIERKSKFDVKSMAGNIIPAISSTNSIIGGLIVLQVINLLKKTAKLCPQNKTDKKLLEQLYKQISKHIFLRKVSINVGNLISSYEVFEPNKSCLVCNTNIPEIEVKLNIEQVTMFDFVETFLLRKLNFVCPDIYLDGTPIIIWSKDDADDYTEEEKKQFKVKPLVNYSYIKDCTRLKVSDLIQNLTVIITIQNDDLNLNENNGLFYKMEIVSDHDNVDSISEKLIESESNGKSLEKIENLNGKKSEKNDTLSDVKDEIEEISDELSSEIEFQEIVKSNQNGNGHCNGAQEIINIGDDDDCEIIEDDKESQIEEDDDDLQLIDVKEKRKSSSDDSHLTKRIRLSEVE